MKRTWWAVAAAVGVVVSAGVTRADFGGPPVMPAPSGPGAGGYGPGDYGVPPANDTEKYGMLPALRKCLWGKRAYGTCGTCGGKTTGGSTCNRCSKAGGMGWGGGGPGAGFPSVPGAGYPGTPGAQMPGTLVYPNHPFARSPRDYFMADPR